MGEAGEAVPLVLDCGTGFCKVGFGVDNAPTSVFPCMLGRPKDPAAIKVGPKKYVYVGEEADERRELLKLSHPVERGLIRNWDDIERVWHHTFYSVLRIAPEEHPVVLAEPALNPKAYRERTLQIMFETFNTPACYVEVQAVLALRAAGRTTGVLLESGDGVTHSIPVYEGHVLNHAVQRLEVAGTDLTEYLMKVLNTRGYSLTTTSEREIVREVKEKLCYVALEFDDAMKTVANSSVVKKSYQLREGHVITLESERFSCPEILFQPAMIAKESPGIHELVVKSVTKSDEAVREALFENIVLSGGSTMFEGMADRLKKELTVLAPLGSVVKVVAPPERKYLVWKGGAMLASLPTFQQMWTSKEEYDDYTPMVRPHRVVPGWR